MPLYLLCICRSLCVSLCPCRCMWVPTSLCVSQPLYCVWDTFLFMCLRVIFVSECIFGFLNDSVRLLVSQSFLGFCVCARVRAWFCDSVYFSTSLCVCIQDSG